MALRTKKAFICAVNSKHDPTEILEGLRGGSSGGLNAIVLARIAADLTLDECEWSGCWIDWAEWLDKEFKFVNKEWLAEASIELNWNLVGFLVLTRENSRQN